MYILFQFTIKMDCTCAKKKTTTTGFSSLSCSDKTTNEKFDGQRFIYIRISFVISKEVSICEKIAKM